MHVAVAIEYPHVQRREHYRGRYSDAGQCYSLVFSCRANHSNDLQTLTFLSIIPMTSVLRQFACSGRNRGNQKIDCWKTVTITIAKEQRAIADSPSICCRLRESYATLERSPSEKISIAPIIIAVEFMLRPRRYQYGADNYEHVLVPFMHRRRYSFCYNLLVGHILPDVKHPF